MVRVAGGLVGAVAATAVVVGVLVWLVGGSDPEPAASAGKLTAGTPSATPAQELEGGVTFEPLPALRITATGGEESLQLVGLRVPILLTLSGPVQRTEHLRPPRTGVVLDDLPAGTYAWSATADGYRPASGTVVVLAPLAPSSPASSQPPATSPPPTQQTFAPPVDPDRN